jgi:hypothetical protein
MSELQENELPENQQATTLDEDLKRIRDAKYDKGLEADVCRWIGQIIGRQKPANETAAVWMKSGDVLCTLMNCIRPGTIKKYNVGTTSKFKQMENITLFLRACREVGMLEKDLFSTVDLFESKDMNAVILSLFNLGGTIQSTIPYFTGPKLGIKQTNRKFDIVPPLEVPHPPPAPPVVAPITDPVPVVLERTPLALDPLPAVSIPEEPKPVVAATTAALPSSPAAAISMAALVKPVSAALVAADVPPRQVLPEVVSSVLSPPIKAVSAIQATVASIPSVKALPANPKLLSPPQSPPSNHRETLPSSSKPPAAPPVQAATNIEMDIKPRKRTPLSSKQIINSTKCAVAQSSQAMSQQQLAPPAPALIQPPQIQMPPPQVHPAALGSYQSYGSHLLRQVSTQQPIAAANRSFGPISQVAPSYMFQQPQMVAGGRPSQRRHIMPRNETEESIVSAVIEWIESIIGEPRHPSLSLYSWLASGEVLCRLANVILGASPNPHIRITNISRAYDENAKNFIQISRLVGVGEPDLFYPNDLYEGRNLGKVIRCVMTLAGVLQNYEWWVNSPFAQLGRRIRIPAVTKV